LSRNAGEETLSRAGTDLAGDAACAALGDVKAGLFGLIAVVLCDASFGRAEEGEGGDGIAPEDLEWASDVPDGAAGYAAVVFA